MNILGIDPGATIGFATLRGDLWIGDGTTRDVQALCEHIANPDEPIDLVVVESVKQVYPRARFSSKMATALLLAERQVGEIVATARNAGLDVLEVSAAQWRSAIVGNKAATDAAIKAVVSKRVKDFPKRSNAHVRDAMGCALFGARWARLNKAAPARE